MNNKTCFCIDRKEELEKQVATLVKALSASNICLQDWLVKGGAKNTAQVLSNNSKLIDEMGCVSDGL